MSFKRKYEHTTGEIVVTPCCDEFKKIYDMGYVAPEWGTKGKWEIILSDGNWNPETWEFLINNCPFCGFKLKYVEDHI